VFNHAAVRLDNVLAAWKITFMLRLIDHLHAQGLSNRTARHALEHGKITLDGMPTADASRDVTGYTVRYQPSAPRISVGRDPTVVWYDSELAVVNKPAHMLAVDAPGRRRETNIVGWAAQLWGAAYPVHRLDEQTSGLMLVARTRRAQLYLKDDLQRHAVLRRYLAIVRHIFGAQPQHYDSVFVRNRGDGRRGSGDAEAAGKRAITKVRLVQALERDASVVEAQLQTGRTHQVRIHLAEAGFPILGDWLYAPQGTARSSARLALHAWHLAFVHPATGESMQFRAPLPDDLERLRRKLAGSGQSPSRASGRVASLLSPRPVE
jgi:23S rRNA pseudouridine1911/1915/1917 synthase